MRLERFSSVSESPFPVIKSDFSSSLNIVHLSDGQNCSYPRSSFTHDSLAQFFVSLVGCITSPADAAHVKAVYDAGHQVASHSWSHKDLATLSKDEST
jgi:hypothetical protein